jgi:hypothetical protein
MPLSQVLAWFFILSSPSRFSLWKTVSEVASFYCAWAVYKRFWLGDVMEFGYITMGCLALASYYEQRRASMAGTLLVLANFLVFAHAVFTASAEDLAKNAKGSTAHDAIVWAYIFKVYFASSIVMWSTVLYKFVKVPQSYPPIDSADANRFSSSLQV